MPLTFNETVPTVTDLLEYCGVEEDIIDSIIRTDEIYDFLLGGSDTNSDIYLIDIDLYIKNVKTNYITADYVDIRNSMPDFHEKMDEFRKTTNSNYIAWC